MTTTLITGNTYPVKDQIKALGGRWDADARGWRVPQDCAAEAQALVAAAPKTSGYRKSGSKGYRKYPPSDRPSRIQRQADRRSGFANTPFGDDYIS